MIYELKLAELATANVTRGEYPEPQATIEDQIDTKRKEIRDYKTGKLERKQAYLDLLEQLNNELSALIIQNDDIITLNAANRKAVDDKFVTDIELAKQNSDLKWEAFGIYVSELLTESSWMVLADSQLGESGKNSANTYRKALMDLKINYATVEEAIANMPENPHPKLW